MLSLSQDKEGLRQLAQEIKQINKVNKDGARGERQCVAVAVREMMLVMMTEVMADLSDSEMKGRIC